jgi:hypothetical protein
MGVDLFVCEICNKAFTQYDYGQCIIWKKWEENKEGEEPCNCSDNNNFCYNCECACTRLQDSSDDEDDEIVIFKLTLETIKCCLEDWNKINDTDIIITDERKKELIKEFTLDYEESLNNLFYEWYENNLTTK